MFIHDEIGILLAKSTKNHGIQIVKDGPVQNCSNSNVLAVELLQSCAKPSTYTIGEISGLHTTTSSAVHACIKTYLMKPVGHAREIFKI